VKISMQPGTSPAIAGSVRLWPTVAVITILAIGVGASIAGANWMLIAALVALPVFLLRPRDLCLGVYAFLLPFDSLSAVGPGGLTLTSIAGAALAAVLLGTAMVKKKLQMPPRPAWWWGLLVAWAAVTVLWALEWRPTTTRNLITSIILLLLYLVALSTNINGRELRTVSLFAVAGACIAAVYTIFQFYHGANYHDEIRGSLMAGDKATDPNYFAATLLLPLSLAVSGFLTPGRWLTRLRWLVVAGTIAFGILVTGSRGAMVAVVVMILFYMYTRHVSRLMTILLVAIFVALAFFMPDSFFTRLGTTAESGGSGRLVVWQTGLVAFERYGLVGAGFNNFGVAYRENVGSAPLWNHTYVSGAHNSYLEVAVELGIVGLVLVSAAIVGQLRAASRCRKNIPDTVGGVIIAYEAACYAILAAGFFISIIWEKWFWLAWIMLAVAVRTSQDEQPGKARAMGLEPAGLGWYDLQVQSAPRARLP
jgi:putative inorganic carbon (hco3(-)) transporter